MKRFTPTRFTVSLAATCGLLLALAAAFVLYVAMEREVDRANELRHTSLLLADELRQSSGDLSRMAMSYVVTGDATFKKYYREVLDIRDGKRPRPSGVGRPYWDFVVAGARDSRGEGGQYTSLLDLLRSSGLTDKESAKLREAKENSDLLAVTELQAIELADSTGPSAAEDRALALAMLHDARYHRAKATIMGPIDDFWGMIEKRTLERVRAAEQTAGTVRYAFIAIGLALVIMLLRTYSILRRTMGGSLDEVHAEIAALGLGDFSRDILVKKGRRDSVLGWLAETQVKLASASRERERAMGRLRESELQFRQIAETIREVLFLGDESGRKWLYVSPGYEELWGRSRGSIYRDPMSWREAIHPDDRARVFATFPPGAESGQTEVDFRILRPDGSLRWVMLRTFPIFDDAGAVQRIAGIAEDTTHRMKIEVVTRAPDRRFTELIDNVELACLMVNAAGRITYCNERFLALTDWTRAQLLGRPGRDVLHPIAGEATPFACPPEIEGLPRSWKTRARLVTREGRHLPMAWNSTVVCDEGADTGIAILGESEFAHEVSEA